MMSSPGGAGAGSALAGAGAVVSGGSGGGTTGGAASGAGTSGGAAGDGAVAGAGGAAAGAGGEGGEPPLAEPALRWLGRVEPTAEGARFSWPGTGFTARFRGRAAKVGLKTEQVDYFQLVVDGQSRVLKTLAGDHEYDLAIDLAEGEHTVVLWRRTETSAGAVEVTRLDWQGGELLAPPPAASKRLEVVGDSISVGFGVECQTNAEAFSFATENNYETYQAIAARELGAELSTVAWSGIGMWRDVGGGTTTQMPERYLRTLGNAEQPRWDFASYVPHAVVVLLGTNDFAQGDPGAPFIEAYQAFVSGVRERYPGARLFLAKSPMLAGGRGAALASYLEQVRAARSAAGDSNVAILELQPPAADAWGCGHPNGAAHRVLAGVLKEALARDLGW